MEYKSIGYQTRSYADSSIKICGGSFGGAIDMETINRLVNAQFTVTVKPSGRAVFIDREGREVWLSVTVDPANTALGVEALSKYRVEKSHKKIEKARHGRKQKKRKLHPYLMD